MPPPDSRNFGPVSSQRLASLYSQPQRVHNICIVAHVDHGKTTLADSLVASNGVISRRMAGKLRYMDSRADEQARGITMKSSAIALLHTPTTLCRSMMEEDEGSRTSYLDERESSNTYAGEGGGSVVGSAGKGSGAVVGSTADGTGAVVGSKAPDSGTSVSSVSSMLAASSICDSTDSFGDGQNSSGKEHSAVGDVRIRQQQQQQDQRQQQPQQHQLQNQTLSDKDQQFSDGHSLTSSDNSAKSASTANQINSGSRGSNPVSAQSFNQPHLINLIDSPGHVDFGAEVSTALSLCDGTLLVVDVVEGVCAQTRQALRHIWSAGIRPVLVLNKIDRLVLEKAMEPLDAYHRLVQVVETVNAVVAELCTALYIARQRPTTIATPTADAARSIIPGTSSHSIPGISGTISRDVSAWSLGLDGMDESSVYFTPESGNVLFASAQDGWAFTLDHFADMYTSGSNSSAARPLSDVTRQQLRHLLWDGDCYVACKRGVSRVERGARGRGRAPLFVQLVLDNVWAVYEAAVKQRDPQRVARLAERLHVRLVAGEARCVGSGRDTLRAVMSQWLPLAAACLDTVITQLPAAACMNRRRANCLMSAADDDDGGDNSDDTKKGVLKNQLRESLMTCSSDGRAPLIILVSKMFAVPRSELPEHRPRPLTPEEMAQRREAARARHAQLMATAASSVSDSTTATAPDSSNTTASVSSTTITSDSSTKTAPGSSTLTVSDSSTTTASDSSSTTASDSSTTTASDSSTKTASGFSTKTASVSSTTTASGSSTTTATAAEGNSPDQMVFIGFGRVLSGCLRPGDEVFVLSDSSCRLATRCRVRSLYLLMGRCLEPLSMAPAGALVGISGLQRHVLRAAVLTDRPQLTGPLVRPLTLSAAAAAGCSLGQEEPIMRVAVEPVDARQLPALVAGLRQLRQADPAVRVTIERSGEHVLGVAGEVHLQRCLADLQQRFAVGCQLSVSAPIAPFRETVVVVPPASLTSPDSTSSELGAVSTVCPLHGGLVPAGDTLYVPLTSSGSSQSSSGSRLEFSVRALPLSSDIIDSLERFASRVDTSLDSQLGSNANADADLVREVGADFMASSTEDIVVDREDNTPVVPGEIGTGSVGTHSEYNRLLLLLHSQHPDCQSCVQTCRSLDSSTVLAVAGTNILASSLPCQKLPEQVVDAIVHGFRLAVRAGPLCDEPMHGVLFWLDRLSIEGAVDSDKFAGGVGVAGQIISSVRQACRRALRGPRGVGAGAGRLMLAMYRCEVCVEAAGMLGRLYATIGRRHGRIVHGDTSGETGDGFQVTALVPVVESCQLASELRKQTSGLAAPQLVFSHWELLVQDPCEVGVADGGEGEDDGGDNRARRYMNAVRQRKGLRVDEQLIRHAEKQRTLSRKK